MNVILNTEEANVVLSLATSAVLDRVELSEESRARIRTWRTDHRVGSTQLNEFTEFLNDSIGNFIDERTRRWMRTRGKLKVEKRS